MAPPRLVFLINRARHALMTQLNRECSERFGITVPQTVVLLRLRRQDGLRIGDLAADLALDGSAMTGMVGRLAERGLVERRRCPTDGRAFRIHLTAAGRAAAEAAWPRIGAVNRKLTEGFTEGEIATVARFLGAVMERFGDAGEEGPA